MDHATAGASLFAFLSVSLMLLLFWDRVGRVLWADVVDGWQSFNSWRHNVPWHGRFHTNAQNHDALCSATAAMEIPLPRSYVEQVAGIPTLYSTPFSAFERLEPPLSVQAVQPVNGTDEREDSARIDAAARLLAAGIAGEASLIETIFAGVRRGGSRRYVYLRDAVRSAARTYGWQESPPPTPLVRTPVAGRPIPSGVIFETTPATDRT